MFNVDYLHYFLYGVLFSMVNNMHKQLVDIKHRIKTNESYIDRTIEISEEVREKFDEIEKRLDAVEN